MVASINFGTTKIDFYLEYSNRKSLGISVYPDLKVLVKAPEGASLEKIRQKVKKRAPWIIRQQNFFHSFQPKISERKYINGETHLYLGRQYRLKVVIQRKDKTESVKLKSGFIVINTYDKLRAEQLLKEWYLSRAEAKIEPLTRQLFGQFVNRHQLPGLSFQFAFRNMPTRWGSCTSKGKIILNPELIKAPKGCIEYVIIHELCHLVHRNHSQKFLALQSNEMPDWEKWKLRLERLLA